MVNFRSIESFKIKNRQISPPKENMEKIFETYIIPHGIYLNDKDYKILVSKEKPDRILVSPKKIQLNIGVSQLFPYFKRSRKILIKNGYTQIDFWQVVNDKDKFDCEMLTARYHHQSVPLRGAILACELPEISKSIIGCAFLTRMTYTSAINNRSEFLDVKIDSLKKMKRGEIVNHFGITWASRFVVHPDFRKFGIGSMIAEVLKEMAAQFYIPSSNFVEIYATMPMTLIDNNNFLIRAGYTKNDNYEAASKISFGFDPNGYRKFENGKRYYYFCDVRRNQDRLFVPLSSEAYSWFIENSKEWEVRNYKGPFTLKNVYIGKKVELRKGYADQKSSIWGIVEDVKRFRSINDLFSAINYNKIIPVAKSLDDAIICSKKYLKSNETGAANIIAIKIST